MAGLTNWPFNAESIFIFLKDVKFPLMLDVYELCTAEIQEKMLPIRSKFKEVEDKKLEKLQKKVKPIYNCLICVVTVSFHANHTV